MGKVTLTRLAPFLILAAMLAGCHIQPQAPSPTPSLPTPASRLAASPPPGLATLVSPSPAEHDLLFETVERGDSDYYHFHSTEPQHVFVITSAQEAARLIGWVDGEAEMQLAQLDYRRYFAIAVFRGHFASSGYEPIVERVARQGERLVVYAHFWAPSPYYPVTAAESNPYHVVKVLRDGGPLHEADLQLETQMVTPTPPAEIRRLAPTPLR
jgi:hypothetical protein